MTVQFGVFPVPEAEREDQVIEQVLLADRLGLDLIGIQDHPYQRRYLDAWTLIAYLAGRTERVRFFPDVANLPLRPPALLAKATASLDRLTGGRVELGLGAGAAEMPRRACPTATLRRMRKTSVYLTDRESQRLAELARSEGRSQADIIRAAINAYVPSSNSEGEFALAAGFARIDTDPRPISEIPEEELLDGFGQ